VLNQLDQTISLGRLRGITRIADEHGIFTITALDHRGTLKSMLKRCIGSENPSWEDIVSEKVRLAKALLSHSSAVLLDPIYGLGPLIARGVIPPSVGILVACEQSGYEEFNNTRITILQPGWSIEGIKLAGGDAVKLLLFYNPEAPEAERQERLVEAVAKECRRHDLPLILEPIVYPVTPGQKKSEPEFADSLSRLVIESARRLVPLGVDVLKAEFVVDVRREKDEPKIRDAYVELSETARVPWVLLSGGADFATFQRQFEFACEAGASGFLAGRAIWQDAMDHADPSDRERFLNRVAVGRLKILNAIASSLATPLHQKLPKDALPTPGEGWHEKYAIQSH
jgi:tagatose 1,6-diphosphate aldolase